MPESQDSIPHGSRPIVGTSRYRISDGGTIWSNIVPGGKGRPGPWHSLKNQVKNRHGHLGVTLTMDDGELRQVSIHRLVLENFVGPCPPGMMARHFPDRDPSNNWACNLIWGTCEENAADRKFHGTNRPGEESSAAKLKNEDIFEIFDMARKGLSQVEIAELFGVDPSNIGCILRRKTWTHLEIPDLGPIPKFVLKGEKVPAAKLKNSQIPEIFRLSKEGLDQGEIAGRYGISRVEVSAILSRRKWQHIEIPDELLVTENLRGGERHHAAVLTEKDVVDIFRHYKDGLSQTEIAKIYGLTVSPIAMVLNRETWGNVEIPPDLIVEKRRPIGENSGLATLKDRDVVEIFRLKAEGVTSKSIAQRIGTTLSTVSTILHRRTWKHVEIDPAILAAASSRAGGNGVGETGRNWHSKIDAEKVVEAFRLSRDGLKQKEIAETLGISVANVSTILARKSWRSVVVPEEFLPAPR